VIEQPAPQARGQNSDVQGPGSSFPPSLAKRFLNAELVGEGGLARVFRAVNAKDGRIVAIKVPIRFDEITGTHFTRDIFFWQGLHHPNIIEIYSSNILPVPYVEMEYAPSSLADLPLPLPEDTALEIIKGVTRGIVYAHGKGIIHRDIKPENILITAEGIPKITDWGLGKAISDVRKSSMIGFSPFYATPEQISPILYGKPGPATDIYQIGVLLYLMLTGNVPFIHDDMHEMSKAILYTTPPTPSWNGTKEEKIQPVLMKCLEKRPADRYNSAAILLEHLEAISRPEDNC
jgi:serine/threonine protein kinase